MASFKRSFFLMMSLCWALSAGLLADSYGRVVYVEGDVKLRRQLQVSRVAVDMVLEQGDVIITGANGTVEVELGEGNDLMINANTRIKLESERALESVWDLEQGSLRASLHNWNSKSFEVRSPAAVAGVRGTDFVAEFDSRQEKDPFHLAVLEGEVEVEGVDPITKKRMPGERIKANQSIRFLADGRPGRRMELSQAMKDNLQKRFAQRRVLNQEQRERIEKMKEKAKSMREKAQEQEGKRSGTNSDLKEKLKERMQKERQKKR